MTMIDLQGVDITVQAGGVGKGRLVLRGGVEPATFGKAGGPDWIDVAEDGTVIVSPPEDLTPGAYGASVRGRDAAGESFAYAPVITVTVEESAAAAEPEPDDYPEPVPTPEEAATRDPEAPAIDAAREPLESINGIGPARAEQFRKAGVADVGALAALDDAMCAELGIRLEWRDDAKIAITRAEADAAAERDATGE